MTQTRLLYIDMLGADRIMLDMDLFTKLIRKFSLTVHGIKLPVITSPCWKAQNSQGAPIATGNDIH